MSATWIAWDVFLITHALIGDPPNILIGRAAGIDFLTIAGNMLPVVLLILAAFDGPHCSSSSSTSAFSMRWHRPGFVGASANVVAASLAERSGQPNTFKRFLAYGLRVTLLSLVIAMLSQRLRDLLRAQAEPTSGAIRARNSGSLSDPS